MTTEELALILGFSADEVSQAVETSAGVETMGRSTPQPATSQRRESGFSKP